MNLRRTEPGRWAIVLAGGEGVRMQPLVERWLGSSRPKQYCAFAGVKTMLEHTLERAQDAAMPGAVVTVIDPSHRRYLDGPPPMAVPGKVLEQPARLDTGPGVLLPLSYIMRHDTEALVTILPSDHFVHTREKFRRLVGEAQSLALSLPDQLVVMAAVPDGPQTDYGWMLTGGGRGEGRGVRVSEFWEKPGARQAEDLFRGGGLWNTMIIVARARALWELAEELEPALMSRFDALCGFMGTPEESAAVAAAYEGMAAVNFSSAILQRAAGRITALPMSGVTWCDWGRPERVVESLERIGRKPAFGREMLWA